MNLFTKIKKNFFPFLIAATYLVLFIFKPETGVSSVKNSSYYIIEMLQIMPVIFILTALLDMWIPKETIMKYLGTSSKIKGMLLSLLMGSVSAGPIYAAFPICTMLLKKGATIGNIVIIISSWAVIKLPMLLNEIKFLGFPFMAIRWILSVIAIFIFSFIINIIVKKEDLPQNQQQKKGLVLHDQFCIGCSLCTKKYPELFIMQGKKATYLPSTSQLDKDKLLGVCTACPAKAIQYIE